MLTQRLSSLQIELLKVYAFNPSESELLSIKEMLARFFSTKMINSIAKSIEDNQISEKDLENWLNESK